MPTWDDNGRRQFGPQLLHVLSESASLGVGMPVALDAVRQAETRSNLTVEEPSCRMGYCVTDLPARLMILTRCTAYAVIEHSLCPTCLSHSTRTSVR